VIITSGPAPFPDIAAETDERGQFALSGLRAGSYTLRAYAPDGRQGEASARLPLSRQEVEIQVGEDQWMTPEEDGWIDDGDQEAGDG
jgi:hypothetical protein